MALKKVLSLAALVTALAGNAQGQPPTDEYHLYVKCDGKKVELNAESPQYVGQRYRAQIATGQSCLLTGKHNKGVQSFDKIADVNTVIVKMKSAKGLIDAPAANYQMTPTKVALGASFYLNANLKIKEPGLYALKVPMETEAGTNEDEYLILDVKGAAPAPVAKAPAPAPKEVPKPEPPVEEASTDVPAPVALPVIIAPKKEPVIEVDASTEIPRVGLEVALAKNTFEGEVKRGGDRIKIETIEYLVNPSYNASKELAFVGNIGIRTSEIASEKNTALGLSAGLLFQSDASSDENKVLLFAANAGFEWQNELLRARGEDITKNLLVVRSAIAYGGERKAMARAEVVTNLNGVNSYTAELGASILLREQKDLELVASIWHALFVNEDQYTAAVVGVAYKGKDIAWSVNGRAGQMSGFGGEMSWRLHPYLYLNIGGSVVNGEGKRTKVETSRMYGGLKFEKIDILED